MNSLMIPRGILIFLTVAFLWNGDSRAQSSGGSCYTTVSGRLISRSFSPAERREIVVLIDETVDYQPQVVPQVLSQVLRLSRPGTRITIGSFSTDSRDTPPSINLSYLFEEAAPQSIRDRLPRRSRDDVDRCLLGARVRGLQQVRAVLSDRFAQARPSIPRTYIMSSLRRFSDRIRASRAPRRTLILVSDMLENSTSVQFYASGRPRMIDPGLELARTRTANLLASLPGVEIYVIGLATIPSSNPRRVQPYEISQQLERFWSAYFVASGTSRVWFGHPLLLQDIP